MSQKPLTVTAQDAVTLRQIDNDFNHRIWDVVGRDERNYQKFEQNLSFTNRLLLTYYVMGLELEEMRGAKRNPARTVKLMGRAFEAMLPSLKKSFGEAAVVAAMPPAATDQRVIDVCLAVGADKLAAVCVKAQNAMKPPYA